jgi:N-acetylglutamate synthase-like GNAT family acetyltransferase
MNTAAALKVALSGRSGTQVAPVHVVKRRIPVRLDAPAIRLATAADAEAIHELIAQHQQEGHLLPRNTGEIFAHAHRFLLAVDGDEVVACGDLAPLSRTVAEIRSLVVGSHARSAGIGRRIVDELVRRATIAGFEKLCAFTHAPGYFVELGFSIVPHVWLPEKIETDCRSCSSFRRCGQYAVMLELSRSHYSCVPLGSLHG